MKANAIFPIAEGIVSFAANLASGEGPIGQAGTPWLRGLKEIINLNARVVSNDFLFDVATGLTATQSVIWTAKAGYLHGALATSTNSVAVTVLAIDKATATGYTTGATAYGATILPVTGVYLAAGSTNPQFTGTLWSPYFKATLGLMVYGVIASDEATGATASKVNWYDFRRNI